MCRFLGLTVPAGILRNWSQGMKSIAHNFEPETLQLLSAWRSSAHYLAANLLFNQEALIVQEASGANLAWPASEPTM